MAEDPKKKEDIPPEVKIDKKLLRDEYINPTVYALGKTAGAIFVLGSAFTVLYLGALKFAGPRVANFLMKPYEGWISVKNKIMPPIVKYVINPIPLDATRNLAWVPRELGKNHESSEFLVSSTMGALFAKFASIPSYHAFKREADAINARTAKRNETIREQAETITQLKEKLGEPDEEEKPQTKFTTHIPSKGDLPFAEQAKKVPTIVGPTW